ncbi:Cilia- and flagella-associated protein 44, partial [Nowakowskiella sp. JEL0078]
MGHIRFWKMALTFTGLKLQGFIGKFGTSELTDIAAFVQLPDGKVLSSTETGNLLLWEGGMIKCEISGKGKKPCHQGRIEVVFLVDQEVFTAGDDGVVRIWDVETIDNADVTTGSSGTSEQQSGNSALQSRVFEMEPVDEILIGKDVKIKSMIRWYKNNHEYLIQDSIGHLLKLDITKRSTEKVLSFHSGSVSGLDTSFLGHSMATLGIDGTLRVYDYLNKNVSGKSKYPSGGTCLTYLPPTLDRLGCTLACGFSDGVLRIITHTPITNPINKTQFYLQFVFKPHTKAITSVTVSPDGKLLCTTSSDNKIFFFKVSIAQPSPLSENPYEISAAMEKEELSRAFHEFGRDTVEIIPIGFVELDLGEKDLKEVKYISFSPDNHLNVSEMENASETSKDEEDGKNDYDKEEEEDEDDNELVEDGLDEENVEINFGRKCLIVLKTGELISMVIPDIDQINTTLSFKIPTDLLKIKLWKFNFSKPTNSLLEKIEVNSEEKKNNEEKNESDTKLEAAASKPEDNLYEPDRMITALRKARGLAIKEDCPVTNVYYLDGGYFVMSLINKSGDAEIRACKIESPEKSRLLLVYKSSFTVLRLSKSGRFLFVGSIDGMACLRKFKIEDILLHKWDKGHEDFESYHSSMKNELTKLKENYTKLSEGKSGVVDPTASDSNLIKEVEHDDPNDNLLGHYWFGYVHSCENGIVNSVTTSWDDSFICSAGSDGGVFTFRINSEVVQKSDVWNDPEITSKMETIKHIEDITDPFTYSIQEHKLKSELDRELEDADIKKQMTRDFVRELRNEFLKLLSENDKSPSEMQLERSFFSVDPDLQKDIEKDTMEKISIVRKELEWISEKESIGPKKLKKKFLDDIQTERIEILAFKNPFSVSTFRTTKLEIELDAAFQPVVNNEKGNVNIKQSKDVVREPGLPIHPKNEPFGVITESSTSQSTKKTKMADTKSKLEARKQSRTERVKKFKELLEAKPDDNYEDSRDVSAIRYAELHMGDYKLKTGEKYIVPENDRVDADKKRRQIMLLKESIYSLKEQFNSQVLRLRDEKKSLIEIFYQCNKSVEMINVDLISLGVFTDDQIQVPNMESSAFPENRYLVTQDDIDEFQKKEVESATQARKDADDLLGAFGGGTQQTQKRSNGIDDNSKYEEKEMISSAIFDGEDGTDTKKVKSGLEMREEEITRKVLLFRKDQLKKKTSQWIKEFDEVIESMSRERVLLEGELKSADIKLLLLYREWALLKEFEKHDNTLAEKLVAKRSEKDDIDEKIKECQEKLGVKKIEIESVIRKEKEIQDEFRSTLGENNKYDEFLTKIFKKKVKRSK